MSAPASASPAASRSGEIDALRAIAMLSVVALHAGLLPCGWIGVWLFFAISGYVVTLSILEQHPGGSPLARLGGFLRRRAVRIGPAYYAYVAAGLLAGLLEGMRQDRQSVASLIGFFDNWATLSGRGMIAGWPSGHLWTLSVEMQFYALYGVALCLLPRRATRALLVGLILLCPLARLGASFWLADHGWKPLGAAYAIYAGPGLHFDTFAMGCLLAFAHERGAIDRLRRPLLGGGAAAVAIYAAGYVGVNHFVRGAGGVAMFRGVLSGILYGQLREVFLYTAIGLAMTGLVAVAVARDAWFQPLLGRRALQRVGEISYGGYLLHALALRGMTLVYIHAGIARGPAPVPLRLVTFLVATAMTLAAARLSYRWFERPLRRALGGARRAAPPVASTPAGELAR